MDRHELSISVFTENLGIVFPLKARLSQHVRREVRPTRRLSFLCLWFAITSCTVGCMALADEVHDAARRGDVARLEQILSTNAALLTLTNADGDAPLYLAAANGRIAVIELLLDRGADVNAANGHEGLSPLHIAARRGRLSATQLLLERGADLNAGDLHGCRPLHSAIYGRHIEVARLLLAQGATVDAPRSGGATPLYFAVRSGDTNLVALLLSHGAQPVLRTAASPLHVAARHGQLALVQLLVGAGADVNAGDGDDQTPLHAAARAGQFDTARWLLEAGADADAKDRLRFTPFDYVTGASNDALADLLQEHMKSRLEQGLPVRVSEAGDPDRLQFSGLETFTADQIREALVARPRYLLAAHPQANMAAYLETLQAMLESGYRAAGFPDAEVSVRYNERAGVVRVKVSEGLRFHTGAVRVSGVSPALEARLIDWFTKPANTPSESQPIHSTSTTQPLDVPGSDREWELHASAGVDVEHRRGGLDTPGTSSRPDEPIWKLADAAEFSASFATQAVLQAEACLAEEGFFFSRVTVEVQRNADGQTADLVIGVLDQGPPGIIGEITVVGIQRHTPADLIRFLDLHEGSRITADRLAEARKRLNDCGRFWDYSITPEYAGHDSPASRRVDLRIEVRELDGVALLGEPLDPVHAALLRLCEWIEGFPSRDGDLQMVFTNESVWPFSFELTVSPGHGFVVNLQSHGGPLPVSVGVLMEDSTVQVCSWRSGVRWAAPRTGVAEMFMHLAPVRDERTNRFDLSLGASYRSATEEKRARLQGPLSLDVQLAPAAFLDMAANEGASRTLIDGVLVLTSKGYSLRADAASGEVKQLVYRGTNVTVPVRFDARAWARASESFLERASGLTNAYRPQRGLSSLIAFGVSEVARYEEVRASNRGMNPEERVRAAAALNRLMEADLLGWLDELFQRNDTNGFDVPMNEVDQAVAENGLAAMFSGFAFRASDELFPKYSWPWTAAREMAFIMMSQGRYTDAELERLYQSERTGPIGCLALARLLSAAGSPAAKSFALRGLMRLGAADFLQDCNLFLRGESGLARSFADVTTALRDLPEDELTALAALLPQPEAELLQESAAALRAQPDVSPGVSLEPALRKYWESSLRARVRKALRDVNHPPGGKGTASGTVERSGFAG